MDRLWAPWRMVYVSKKRQRGCIFCKAKRGIRGSYIVFKTRHSLCILNIFPYNNGHVMIAPLRHTRDISGLTDQEVLDLFRSLAQAQVLLQKILKPQGFNIGINISRYAGAGIVGHLHIHLVPRWHGDTNFMPVVHATKVISQSLDELYKSLRGALPAAA